MFKYVLSGWLFFMAASTYGQSNTLQFYIDNAVQHSPLLKEYQNQVQLNMYDSLLIRAGLKVQVTGTSVNTYAPVIKGYGYDNAISNGGNFATLVGINKPLLNQKNLNAQFQTISLQNQIAANTSQITAQDLKRSVIAQYITAEGSLQQLTVNQDISRLLSKEEIILKKLTQSNIYKQADYLAFLVTLQQQDLLVKQLSIQYKTDLGTLRYLSGITDTTTEMLQSPNIALTVLPGIEGSVFFTKFALDSLTLINSKRLVDINYRPRINLYADAGFNSSLTYQAYKNFGTSFGFNVVVPIYDGKQKKLQYGKIDVQEKTRSGYQQFFKSQYQQQVAQLTQQLSLTEDLIVSINNQLKYTQSLIEVNGRLLEAGEVRVTDYIIALNNFINAKNLITQNNISRLQIINQLNYWNR